MPPCPNISRIGLTFDLDLWPTDLNIDMGHLLINDYLPTKFEAPGAKGSWVISCTCKVSETKMTFDLLPSDLNINRDHLFITDYLPTKFEACGAKRSWVIRYKKWSRLAWPLTFGLLTWISIGIIYSSRIITPLGNFFLYKVKTILWLSDPNVWRHNQNDYCPVW